MKDTLNGKYSELIGLSKKEVLQQLGDGFNFYPDTKWSYILKKYWYGRKKLLFIEFDHNGIVISQYIISEYEK